MTPTGLKTTLRPHQLEFLDQFADLPEVANLADPGLGKTPMTLAWLQARNARRILWLTVPSFVGGTADEITRLSTYRSTRDLSATAMCTKPGTITLMSYNDLRHYRSELALIQDRFDAVVADESHKLKRIQSQRTKAAIRSTARIPNRTILTGSYRTNSLFDIWAQFLFLDQGATLGRSYIDFRQRYYRPNGPFEWVEQPWALQRIRDLIRRKAFFCDKTQVADLPPIVRKRVPVPLHSKVQRLYDELSEEFTVELQGAGRIDTTFVVVKLTRMAQMVSGAFVADDGTMTRVPCTKREAFKTLLADVAPEGNRNIVVWCRFRFEVEDVAEVCKKAGIPTYIIAGVGDPTQTVREFQNTRERSVAIVTLSKGSEAITLTSADTVIYYNRTPSVDQRLQSRDRTHRIGSEQHKEIRYYDLYTKDTVEQLWMEDLMSELVQALKAKAPEKIQRHLRGKI